MLPILSNAHDPPREISSTFSCQTVTAPSHHSRRPLTFERVDCGVANEKNNDSTVVMLRQI
jgi:hypothetical protein